MVPSEGSSRVYEVEITSLDVEGVCMVTLTVDNLNHFTIQTVDPELREVIQIKAKESYQNLILDISKVEIIDSAGVGAFVALRGFAQKNGLTLHLCAADPKVARILRMMQIHKVLPFHVSKEAALKACSNGSGS